MRRLTVSTTVLVSLAALLLALPSLDGPHAHGGTIIAPGEKPSAAAAATEDFIEGNYWALIIGIDKYPKMTKDKQLEVARKDAAAVAKLLKERYGFSGKRMIELYDEAATRKEIIRAFSSLIRSVTDKDSLFIYHAGQGDAELTTDQKKSEHGYGRAYWLPSDAQLDDPSSFIFDSQITDFIANIPARHIFLVVDSDFHARMGRTRAIGLSKEAVKELYRAKSRWALVSGGLHPVTDVADKSKNGHSTFAWHFLKILGEYTNPYLLASDIVEPIATRLSGEVAGQLPRSGPVLDAGDEGGQFVFRLRKEFQKEIQPLGSISEGQARREAEEAKPVEEARARPVEAPGQREITGKDWAPMVLVPAGEFLYGVNNERLSLQIFYMDKFEVTTKLYAAFMQATGRAAPASWNEVSQVRDGDRPVIGVNWYDADAYCRHYEKRLPTEQEWEKAARGTDGRKYPWGNEEPTSRHANFGKCCDWKGSLTAVGSFEVGASPYRIYDLAGNVFEWTDSSKGSDRVFRGGSWNVDATLIRSAARSSGVPALRLHILGFRCVQDAPR